MGGRTLRQSHSLLSVVTWKREQLGKGHGLGSVSS